jgi:hypothetical protein
MLEAVELFVNFNFEMCHTHYISDGRVMFSTVWSVRMSVSQIIATDILVSDHLPIMLTILDPDRAWEALYPVVKFADWEQI